MLALIPCIFIAAKARPLPKIPFTHFTRCICWRCFWCAFCILKLALLQKFPFEPKRPTRLAIPAGACEARGGCSGTGNGSNMKTEEPYGLENRFDDDVFFEKVRRKIGRSRLGAGRGGRMAQPLRSPCCPHRGQAGAGPGGRVRLALPVGGTTRRRQVVRGWIFRKKCWRWRHQKNTFEQIEYPPLRRFRLRV